MNKLYDIQADVRYKSRPRTQIAPNKRNFVAWRNVLEFKVNIQTKLVALPSVRQKRK